MPRTILALILLCVIGCAAITVWMITAFGSGFGPVTVLIVLCITLCLRYFVARRQ